MAIEPIIKSDGKEMQAHIQCFYVDVNHEFNKVPMAELHLIERHQVKEKFALTDDEFFAPGKAIEISISVDGEPFPLFKGLSVAQRLSWQENGPVLVIDLVGEAVKMTSVRKNKVYQEKKDSDIIKELIGANQLTAETAPTTQLHKQMVQYYATDWDFMVSRAEANGQVVLAKDGQVTTLIPEVAAPTLTLEFDKDDIYDFDFQANARSQLKEVSAMAWDIKAQKMTPESKGTEFALSQGNYEPAKIAPLLGGDKAVLMHGAEAEPGELKAWADGQVIKSRLSLLRGWVAIPFDGKVKAGDTLEIKGLSARFSGKTLISGVRHQFTAGGRSETMIQVGLSACWFYEQPHVTDAPAAGLLPGINGLQVGIVEAFEADPADEQKLKVKVPAFGDPEGVVWARLLSPDAGKERGFFFRPEPGDEVVVGFLNDDPRQAVVMGSLYSSVNATPVPVADKNPQKGLFTLKKYQLLFDEQEEKILLATSEKNSITINEKEGVIEVLDANQNQVTLDKNGVKVTSGKDLELEIKGNFKVNASGNVEIKGAKVEVI